MARKLSKKARGGIRRRKLEHYTIVQPFGKRRNVTITEAAFSEMVMACLEVYKKESFGILLGEVHKKHYLVTDTYYYQEAKRTYDAVDVKQNRINRINSLLTYFSTSKVIGDFHSHPGGPSVLSGFDKEEILHGDTQLAVLVCIWPEKRQIPWRVDKDLSISGTAAEKYFVKIRAFEADTKANRVYPIKIVCPYLRKFNKLRLYVKKHPAR
ncbi:Mov34/MPN/PAD-1 family protein [Candidatus Woesearchaeota archaeon]|nr:Mov34/MPN/PAD-1 family protein [Candidatus Woesearchaeota archaeon]